MPFTQTDRLIRIDTPLGDDVLLLRGFSGEEGLSQLFRFELDLLTEGPAIDFGAIIGQPVTIRVELIDEKERFFNGYVSRFAQTGSETGVIHYSAEMVPWLWFLTRTADCRMFQNKSTPDIIEQIFADLGFTDYRLDLQGTYDPREYCVQYRETDFNFISRLMEQYGMFYFFEHEESKHTLVIGDHSKAHKKLPTQPIVEWEAQGSGLQEEDVINSLEFEKEFRPGKFSHTDFNFKTPSTSLAANEPSVISIGGNNQYEIYDYPGEYEKKANGQNLAKVRMEEEEAQHLIVTGGSTVRAFTSGYTFTLQDYFPQEMNQAYLLTNVSHMGTMGNSYSPGGGSGGSEQAYSNTFSCIPASVPYRSQQVTPKPVVQGPQTAIVVGPSGEEIWCDEFGRVKVQFHWDREGKNDENSSMFVRVSQLWAGKGWGAMFIPRIGHEVVLEFLEGDPDRPLITGRVYHAENMPPYPLPAEATKSTIKSNSSKGGGGSNEFRFEDKKGSEEMYLHAEKDQNTVVENDQTTVVKHDQAILVENDRTKTVKNNQWESIEVDKTISVGGNHAETITGSMTQSITGNMAQSVDSAKTETITLAKALSIGGAYQVSVGAAMNETVGGAKTEEVGAYKGEAIGGNKSEVIGGSKSVSTAQNLTETVGKDQSVTVAKNLTEKVGGKHSEQVTKEFEVKAKKIQLIGEDQIVLKAGKAEIVMKKNGDIVINGKKINIKGSGDVIVKGSKIKGN